ncbi:MAG: glutamyl-tRNA amidotransferase [Ignavibacteria bacterium GWB2_35_12]|nr:MAG: glutamyl-tRNA amidotransferase [Ignavibacteria bacterium GWA2_35_8]OGU38869.1 MAG: glutamyl-tRNA amidotransferase [Ignavibacteria bacterium GWB2_35_12]OGU94400.1 MAG: glutamyl-tRNA amidotransferase [Ignavibacteria bacterium RIFOXYA2_FULL_35_10]OGV20323.1 MAG: glutamyl-tRNA amidotransferase [Ignavibacteria bacterium RIFOXYC2_FULL_35_21]
MGLEEKINEELKNSIKSGDKIRMETLRSIRAGIIEFNKSGAGREMNEEDGLKILNSNAKKRKDAIALYEQGGRTDLADKEKQELAIIGEFLPQQLSDDEVKDIIKKIKNEIGAVDIKDLGKVMGPVMKELKGKADGGKVQQFVREILSTNES